MQKYIWIYWTLFDEHEAVINHDKMTLTHSVHKTEPLTIEEWGVFKEKILKEHGSISAERFIQPPPEVG